MLGQAPSFDDKGFSEFMREEFANDAPIAFIAKGQTYYARRSRTEDSGWRLEAFTNPHDDQREQRIAVLDLARCAERVYVDYTSTDKAYRRRGIYSALKDIHAGYVSQFGGKICRGLTGELLPDGEAIAIHRNPEAEALRKLFMRLNVMRGKFGDNPYIDVTPDQTDLWGIFAPDEVR